MRKFFVILFVTVVTLALSGVALAQECTDSDRESMNVCAGTALETCEQAFSNCEVLGSAVTIEDVKDIAVARCCGKKTTKARRNCIRAEKRRYSPRTRRGAQKTFFKAARSELLKIQKSDCYSDAYTQLF